jgi:hypothetical protein
MNFSALASRVAKFTSDNSPTILTAIGVVGTVTTAILTGKAAFKASQIIDDHEDDIIRGEITREPLTNRQKVELTWNLFIPPLLIGSGTVAAIIFANRIHARRATALIAAYALSENRFADYKEKIVKKLGQGRERKARTEIAQDKVTANPPPSDLIWDETSRSVLCCDLFTGRYFMSDMETLRKAENDINHQNIHYFHSSLTDFYHLIGLPATSMSDDVGWNSDKMLELDFDTVLTPNGKPCLTIDFKVIPIRGYARVS